jgi:hypothetical protein
MDAGSQAQPGPIAGFFQLQEYRAKGRIGKRCLGVEPALPAPCPLLPRLANQCHLPVYKALNVTERHSTLGLSAEVLRVLTTEPDGKNGHRPHPSQCSYTPTGASHNQVRLEV